MRREIILNLICNHRISPALKWQDFPKVNHLSWFATDFSEETNGVDEIFTVKFKVFYLGKQKSFSNKFLFFKLKKDFLINFFYKSLIGTH